MYCVLYSVNNIKEPELPAHIDILECVHGNLESNLFRVNLDPANANQ